MTSTDPRHRPVAEILAALMSTPEHHRLDALALAIRAAIDSGIVRAPLEIR